MKLIIYGDPRTKKNSQQVIMIGKFPKVLPSKQYLKYEKESKQFLPTLDKPLVKRYNVKCVYYMQTRRKVDLGNLLSATNDILVKWGILQDDNSDIVISHDGSRVRYDKTNPRAEIFIEKIEDICFVNLTREQALVLKNHLLNIEYLDGSYQHDVLKSIIEKLES